MREKAGELLGLFDGRGDVRVGHVAEPGKGARVLGRGDHVGAESGEEASDTSTFDPLEPTKIVAGDGAAVQPAATLK